MILPHDDHYHVTLEALDACVRARRRGFRAQLAIAVVFWCVAISACLGWIAPTP